MKKALAKSIALGLLVMFANAACKQTVKAPVRTSGATRPAAATATQAAASTAPRPEIHYPGDPQRALGIYQPWSDADIEFMTGMIPHHAQAVIMAGWARSHGAREDVAILCERTVVGQGDEIRSMQQWLKDRALPVPSATDTRMHMKMDGMEHDMLMPGMLSDEEMAELDKARGKEWDRLFLIGMIKHHGGAIDRVNVLFKAYGAAQDDGIYRFASDVFADQSIEIEVMQKMLESIGGGS